MPVPLLVKGRLVVARLPIVPLLGQPQLEIRLRAGPAQ